MDEQVPAAILEPITWYKNRVIFAVAIAAVVVIVGAAYLWLRKDSGAAPTPEEAREEVRDLVALVSELIVLPEGEEPVTATVADPEQLKDQPFFAKAKRGDRVLIYNIARKAILYDPVAHRIVEVAPLSEN